jgi:4'-phosphopantetheinyl transferase EntD
MARILLSEQEQRYFEELPLERRRHSYLLGRFAAKTAVFLLTNQEPGDIAIGHGVFRNPVIGTTVGSPSLEVSITHCDGRGAAVAFPAGHPMGIDLERIDANKIPVFEGMLTDGEMEMFKKSGPGSDYALMLTAAWTVKESLSKIFKTGLMTPLSVYEISKVERTAQGFVSYFTNFGQYKATSLILDDGHVCSITFPRKTELELDLPRILSGLS